jgi:NAD(P)-dependent dehydrogenase (short-subunit alcohol dehydrogenase family)
MAGKDVLVTVGTGGIGKASCDTAAAARRWQISLDLVPHAPA